MKFRLGGSRKLRIAVSVLASLSLVVAVAGYVSAGYGDGSGTMTVAPTTVAAGATGQTFTFTYTASVDFGSNSDIRLTIPAGWTAPQKTNAANAGYVTVAEVGNNNCNPGNGWTVSGMDITIPMTCQSGEQLTIVYGAGTSAAKVTAPTTAGPDTFQAESQYGNGGRADLGASPVVTVTAAAAAKLAFTVQPSNTTVGSSIAPSVVVTVQDAYSNTVSSSTASITLAIGTNPGGGVLSGVTAHAAVAGVATFSGLSINRSATGYTLTAASGSLTGATSTAFNIAAGTANKLAFIVQPSNTTAGSSVTPSVAVTIQDALGNTVNSTANVTIAIGTNPGAGTLSGTTTHAAVAGVATFGAISINRPGTGYILTAASTGLTGATSSAFNINVGAANKLAFTVQPSNAAAGAAIAPSIVVTIQDAAGNTVNSNADVTVSIGTNPGGGTLSGTTAHAAVAGVANFTDLSINRSGTGYTLSAASAGLTGATSSAFNINVGAANKLVFTTQPSNTTAGSSITPSVVVTIQDALGNTVNSNANVTLAIGTNPGGGTLSGTTTHAAVAGAATFSGLSINRSSTGYTLTAASGSLTGATSSAFNINVGTADKLAFTVQPSNAVNGAAIAPSIVVTIQDAAGNTVTTSTANVTLAIQANPAGGSLSGTATHAAVAGVATFSGLSINNVGNGYTLRATSTNLTNATSAAFDILGTPLSVTFYKRICDTYSAVPANRNPTDSYSGWGGNETGGHNGQLHIVANTTMTNNTTDLACDPYTSNWNFTVWDAQGLNGSGRNLLGTVTTSGASGSATITLDAAELALARGNGGLWISETENPALAGFGSIRCYNDINYSDNSEHVFSVPTATTQFYCVGYNVKPKISFAALPTKTYGAAPFTLGASTTATGAGVGVTFTATGPCATSGANGTTLTITGAGTCAVTAHEAQVPGTTNFWSAASDVSQSFTVAAAALDVTGPTLSRAYGASNPTMTPAITGFVNGDGLGSITVPTCTTAAVASSVPGDYPITCSGAVSTKYSFTYHNGALTVEKVALSITANDLHKTYGAALAPGVADLTVGALLPGDSVAGITLTSGGFGAGADAGSYGIVPSAAMGTGMNHYNITYHPGTLVVDPAVLTVTGPALSRAHGASNPTFTPAIAGFVNGDGLGSITVPTCTTAANASSLHGVYAITCSGGVSANYGFVYHDGTLTVGAPTLTITASSASMPYGGPVPTIAPIVSGFVGGDTLASLTGTVTCTTTATAGSPASAIPHISSCTGATSTFYVIHYVDGEVTVTRAPLTITASSASVLFGGSIPAITPIYSGYVAGESDADLTTKPICTTAATSGSAIGTYPSSCSGAAGDNYAITYVNGTVAVTGEVGLGLVKVAKQPTFTKIGDVIDYTYTLTNLGNVPLSGPFTVTDDKIPSVACPDTATLAAGASIVCTGSYAITIADLDAGKVVNTATAQGLFGESNVISVTKVVTVTQVQLQSIEGATSGPAASATPPVTSATKGSGDGNATPLFALLICLAFGCLGLLAIQGQRRSVRR